METRTITETLWLESVDSEDAKEAAPPDDVTMPPDLPVDRLNIRPGRISDSTANLRESDFELIKVLDKGGMGVIYLARQNSIYRRIAIKMMHTEKSADAAARRKFIAEAMVTGELDHPNIVPIHELGLTQDNRLFYAMKQVKGVSWKSIIREKSESENIEILLRVCDAMAFAHDKGVIHRDLKPENIMLGEYGEVFVMDWGIALILQDVPPEEPEVRRGAGTPAYMAPEMTRCDDRLLGPFSDIYLLGGILYEIITGLRPHIGKNVRECVRNANRNIIQPSGRSGELVDIALKAMAADPQKRFPSVKAFQKAIREYITHAESIALARDAAQDLERAETSQNYDDFARSLFRYRESVKLWAGNRSAAKGVAKACLAYAQAAFRRDDFDLALSLLDPAEKTHKQFIIKINQARRKRKAWQARMRALTRGLAVLVGLIIVILTVAFFWIRGEKERALAAEKTARSAQAQEAAQRRLAEQANYLNVIALAGQKIDNALFNQAETLLRETPEELRGWEWSRLMLLCNMDLLTLKGHQGGVEAVAFSPDGRKLVTGGRDQQAMIWDLYTGKRLQVLKGHQADVRRVRFTPDGTQVETIDRDNRIIRWSVATGGQENSGWADSDYERNVAVSPDGRLMAMAAHDFTARIFDTTGGRELSVLQGHSDTVFCVAFSPDGTRLATGSQDNTARVWNIPEARTISVLKGHSGGVLAVCFSPDGTRVATGSLDMSVKIWDAAVRRDLTLLAGHTNEIHAAAFDPASRRVITGSRDHTGRIWDLETGKTVLVLQGHTSALTCAVFSPDGRTALTASRDETLTLWNTATGKALHSFRGHAGPVTCAIFSPDGRRILSSGWDRAIRIWNSQTGDLIATLQGHQAAVLSLAISPDGQRLVSGDQDGKALIWDLDRKERLIHLDAHRYSIYGTGFSPDGRRIVTAGWDQVAICWDAETGHLLRRFEGHVNGLQSAGFSPDGRRVITAGRDGTARIWDTESGRELMTLKADDDMVFAASFSPDGRKVLTAGKDMTARIWHAYDPRKP